MGRSPHYDPVAGRFASEDKIQDDLNWYAYCHNNPVNQVDPDGQLTWLSAIGVLIAALTLSYARVNHEARVVIVGGIVIASLCTVVDIIWSINDLLQKGGPPARKIRDQLEREYERLERGEGVKSWQDKIASCGLRQIYWLYEGDSI